MADDIVQRIRENLPCIKWEQPLAAERERLAADEIVRLRSIFDRDQLYPIIDEVLHERWHPYTNAGSTWIDTSDGDIQLRIHLLTKALCDAIVARLAGGAS